ncbi:MAG TPA: YkvA family protein [Xanthobacteraceae bacterium]
MFQAYTATWQNAEALARRMASGEREVRREFWRKLQSVMANLPFVEDVLTAYYCAFDRQTPLYVKAVMLAAVAYFVLPDDLIPDFTPAIGYADDAAVLTAAMKLFARHIRPEHRAAAKRMCARLRDDAYAARRG